MLLPAFKRCSRLLYSLLPALALVVSAASPAAPQDNSLALFFSLDAAAVTQTQSEELGYVLEFRNQLKEPLRYHPRQGMYDTSSLITTVCFQSADGRRYLSYTMPGFRDSAEVTAVLAPGASAYFSWQVCWVVEADEEWLPKPSIDGQEEFAYYGRLPSGHYQAFAQCLDGPALNQRYPERAPAWGIYSSNRVPLTVVPDDGEPPPVPCLVRSGGRVFKHGAVELVRADALSPYRVTVTAEKDRLAVRRGKQHVELPIAGMQGARQRKGEPPFPALPGRTYKGGVVHYVPLRYVAEKLSLRVRYDPKKKVYDLKS